MRRRLLIIAVLSSACGSFSPAGPSSTSSPLIATAACPTAPIVGFALELSFYQQIACNAFDGPSTYLRKWTRPPALYIRTVDEGGNPIDAVTLETVQNAMTGIAPALTGGKFGLASVERGTGTREGDSGYVTVKWMTTAEGITCGASNVALDGGTIDLYPHVPTCACNGSAIRPGTAQHELGHAFGYWHTDGPDDLMSNQGIKPCDRSLSAREQQAVAYHYR